MIWTNDIATSRLRLGVYGDRTAPRRCAWAIRHRRVTRLKTLGMPEMIEIFHYIPHPRIQEHHAAKPTKVVDERNLNHQSAVVRFNARMGLGITTGVGTMWAAYVFACISLLALPYTLSQVAPSVFSFFPGWLVHLSLYTLVSWISAYFLQLVLLPIIIVGQNIQARASDRRAEDTYRDAEAVLHEATQIQAHLAAQDQAITSILDKLSQLGHA
jgi:hypothetical protein